MLYYYGIRLVAAVLLGLGVIKTLVGMGIMQGALNWFSYRIEQWHSDRYDRKHPGWHEELTEYLNSQTRPKFHLGEQWNSDIHGKPIER